MLRDGLILVSLTVAVVVALRWDPAKKGVIDDRSSHTDSKQVARVSKQSPKLAKHKPSARKNSRPSPEAGKAKGLGYIYAKKALKRQAPTATARKITPLPSTKVQSQKVVMGVPLNSFIQHRLNSLPSAVSPGPPQGVRVFVQCMELHKGKADPLDEHACNQLVAQSASRGKNRVLGGP